MAITYHPEMIQGTTEWREVRRGMLTASEMDLILTPTFKTANNEKERGHVYELLAQRITGYVEPRYISDAMLRGNDEEIFARAMYSEKYAKISECGFVTNNELGWNIGFSPDGLVGEDGLIEIKSRKQSLQTKTIVEGILPSEYFLQIQTGLWVTKREWCDFISYSNGMPMFVLRVFPDKHAFAHIVVAATVFEEKLEVAKMKYDLAAEKFHMAKRRDYEEIVL